MSAYNEGKRYINPNKEYPASFKSFVRYKIRERDVFKCQICGKEQTSENLLDVHHIDYDKNNIDANNLISLCHSCHSRTQTKRFDWKSRLTNILKEKSRI
jgi:5-methylcytosine-specific restriction endonuclease McrA